jgi:osmoprotectant transport system ATP-binding protein
MIRLTNVTKVYPGTASPAVDALSLDIGRGEIAVFVGPSGCGKTTTLKMINRLIEPTSGTIEVDGHDVTELPAHELRRHIGYVIQQIGLFPHKKIGDNIATVPKLLGWDRTRIRTRVDELVDLVDLAPDMLERYPSELSGGQRQRVGVARALAADPPVLLMDEPFGAVDPIVRSRLQDELLDLQARLNKTIAFVTHDIDEAIKLGDRVAILNVGGILEQYGPPGEILRDPANPFVADFLGTDRGIKRLSLIPVSRIVLERGPVVLPSANAIEVEEMMARHNVRWVGVGEGERLDGWIDGNDLDGAGIDPDRIKPFQVRLGPGSTLKEALDAVVSSHTEVAAVFDGDRFLGMVSMKQISREIVQ